MQRPSRKYHQFQNKHRTLKRVISPVEEQRIKIDFKKMSNLHELSKKLMKEINQTTIHHRNSGHLRTIYKSVDFTHSNHNPASKMENTGLSSNFINSWMKPTADHLSKKRLTVKEHENYYDIMKPAEISSFKKQLKNINTIYITKKKEEPHLRNSTVELVKTLPIIPTQPNSKRVLHSRQAIRSRNAKVMLSPGKTSVAPDGSTNTNYRAHTSAETYPIQIVEKRRSSNKTFQNTPEQGEAEPTPRKQKIICLWKKLKQYVDIGKCSRYNAKRRYFKQTGQYMIFKKKKNFTIKEKLNTVFEKRRCEF